MSVPQTPEQMAALLNVKAPPAAASETKKKVDKPQTKALPAGRMGQPCSLKAPNGKPCTGKLSDLSRVNVPPKGGKGGHTLITLFCPKCNVVQAQANIPRF